MEDLGRNELISHVPWMETKILDREDPRPKSPNSMRDLRFSFSQARAASFLSQYAFYSKPVYFQSTRPDISL